MSRALSPRLRNMDGGVSDTARALFPLAGLSLLTVDKTLPSTSHLLQNYAPTAHISLGLCKNGNTSEPSCLTPKALLAIKYK